MSFGGGCLHAERLMRSAVIVELDPVANHAHGVALVLEAVPVHALLFHRLAVGLLQVLQLALVLLPHVLGLGPQGVLHAPLAVLDPGLDVRRRPIKLPARLGVLPRMISRTSADFRRAVHRLISSSIVMLIGYFLARLPLGRKSVGQYNVALCEQIVAMAQRHRR